MPQISDDITVVIPTIPPRKQYLKRAMQSVGFQSLHPAGVITSQDNMKRGAAANRDAALAQVETPYVAFLDDDDEFGVHHLERLYATIRDTDADLVYPWFTVVGGTDPFPQWFGKPWDNDNPVQTTITTIAKTEAVRACGGFCGPRGYNPGIDALGHQSGEDQQMVLRLMYAGGKIVHLPERTWFWHHHGRNTSGMPTRW